MASLGPRMRELGKAKKAPSLESHTKQWTKQVEAVKLRRRLAENKRHQLVHEYQKLKFQEVKEMAKLITFRPTKRKEEMTKLVTSFLDGTISQYEKLGLKTDALKRTRDNPEKMVKNIMRLQETKFKRTDQKVRAVSVGLLAFASSGLILGGATRGDLAGAIERSVGYVAGGAAGANIVKYKLDRKDIRNRIEELRRKREELADRLI
jgi:hypothetical protein